jgi:CRISPR-associated protein Cas2
MFVAVCCDLSSSDHQNSIGVLLSQYGFQKIQNTLYEHTAINDEYLTRLKKDLDRQTDYYDIIRMYQYPVENTLVITSLKQKKWRKLVVKVDKAVK